MKIVNKRKEYYKGYVYNFHTSPDQDYFANGVLVHNCYKSNTPNGKHMSFETFKQILSKFPKYNGEYFLTQIAFGIGDVDADDDLFKMMIHCRINNIVPNVTINGDRLTKEIIEKLVIICGAVSVSRYENKDICYNAVKSLTDAGLEQVNIHQMVSENTYDQTLETIEDIKNDSRLSKLNAVVYLSLKQKGRGLLHKPLKFDKFRNIVEESFKKDIRFGFDSCGANKVIAVLKEIDCLEDHHEFIEPCESASFSYYIDVNGVGSPCSFSNKCAKGIDILKTRSFIDDVWTNDISVNERIKIQNNNRSCPYFKV